MLTGGVWVQVPPGPRMTIKTIEQLDKLLRVLRKHNVEAVKLGNFAVQFPSQGQVSQSNIGFAVVTQSDDDEN